MAAPPSATALRSSAEAFTYPLPTVRQLQKQVSAALDEKNARLRTLVGGSYRELLGTAELIVDMRRDIAVVEDRLAGIAEGCSKAAVGRKVAGLARLGPARRMHLGAGAGARGYLDALDGEVEVAWAARVKALSGCVLVVGRLLKSRGVDGAAEKQSPGHRLVVAAKVLVLSRLLLKSLGTEAKAGLRDSEKVVEEMKTKVSALRRRLLRRIERMLQRIDGGGEDLTLALSAYSLATSSGARDVLRHFLYIRGEALALAFAGDEDPAAKVDGKDSVTRALSLYTRTLLDVQALAPRWLPDALLALKGKHLLNDEALRELEELRLDVCEKWLGDEILYFTPYIRHDDLDGPQAMDTLKGWAKKAAEVLLQGFETMLDGIQDFRTVVSLRTKVYEIWIREGSRAQGFDASIMLDDLRKVVNSRLDKLLKARVTKLHLVGTEVKATLDLWTSALNEKATSLWDNELLDMELTNGAGAFKQAIIAHVYGRNDAVSRVITGYEAWRRLIGDLFIVIETLKKQRWDGDIENLDDDDILEDRNTLLSKDDPEMLQQHLEASLKDSFEDLEERLATILATYRGSEHNGGIATFILRILRGIRAQLPQSPGLNSFGLSLIPGLHKTLAEKVSAAAMSNSKRFIPKKKEVLGRALWEGSPELPVQPSPATFRLLQALVTSMTEAGSDLWSPAAVMALKHCACTGLVEAWLALLEASGHAEADRANGDEKAHGITSSKSERADSADNAATTSDAEQKELGELETEVQKDLFTQSLFDFLVLKQCLLTSSTSEDGQIDKVEERLRLRLELPAASFDRLQQGAKDYWKRMNLLFGLLSQ